MKLSIICIYWTLLLVSVISSGLLFLIVASEDIYGNAAFQDHAANDIIEYNNESVDEGRNKNPEEFETGDNKYENKAAWKTDKKNQYRQDDATGIFTNFELLASEGRDEKKDKDVDIFVESLTRQPNLSQGSAESGEGIVLSLADTAAAELQSLVEPKINGDLHSAPSPKNTSFRQIPVRTDLPPSAATTTATTTNETINTEEPSEPLVLIVRAEQKAANDPPPDKPTDNLAQASDTSTTTASSAEQEGDGHGAPRTRLIGEGIREESAGVPVDGIIPAGHEEHQEEIPSFSEWTQKRLEEAERKKTAHANASIQNAAGERFGGSGGENHNAGVHGAVGGVGGGGSSGTSSAIGGSGSNSGGSGSSGTTGGGGANSISGGGGGSSRESVNMKIRSKNYASPDCGAKIVAANPESRSAKNVLVSTRDEYMLNTCTSRIWFVVELCEAIQAKKIELANFELFSSSPKDFAVYVSDRFPTRDWTLVGRFTARDERDVQSFPLHPRLFAKFVKFELHSHYGSEHFCPISLFRAYGTSEFEVLETETENGAEGMDGLGPSGDLSRMDGAAGSADESDLDDDREPIEEEETLLGDDNEGHGTPHNLFGSARDAVISIVKKAAEVLVKSGDFSGNDINEIRRSIDAGTILPSSYSNCMTPRYTILCRNCSNRRFAKVFQLISCGDQRLNGLVASKFLGGILARNSRLCREHGIETMAETSERDFRQTVDPRASFFFSLFEPDYIVALCNILATRERKVLTNESYAIPTEPDVEKSPLEETAEEFKEARTRIHTDTSEESSSQFASSDDIVTSRLHDSTLGLASRIKPTRTFAKDDPQKDASVSPVVFIEPSREHLAKTSQPEVLTTTVPPPPPPLHAAAQRTFDAPRGSSTPADLPVDTSSKERFTATVARNSDNQQYHRDETAANQRKVDAGEREAKRGKGEGTESQENAKSSASPPPPTSSDHIALDSLLSDLKDLEAEATASPLPSPPAANSQQTGGSSTQAHPSTASTPSSAPQQKESVFLRLSNRIKALERNMSLSGQYLEELSRRYKKQVEDMQRSLERAVSAMGEESRKGEEREAKRLEEIGMLKEEIALLSRSIKRLLHERDSWYSSFTTIAQHALLLCLEIVLVLLVLSYCRVRRKDLRPQENGGAKAPRNKFVDRKSTDYANAKKSKKRRPSEIASRITGSYRGLMIEGGSTQQDRAGAPFIRKEQRKEPRKEASKSHKGDSRSRSSTKIRRENQDTDVSHSMSGSCGLYGKPAAARRDELSPADSQLGKETKMRAVESNISILSSSSASFSSSSGLTSNNSEDEDAIFTRRDDAAENSPQLLPEPPPAFMKTALGSRSKRMLEQKAFKRSFTEKFLDEYGPCFRSKLGVADDFADKLTNGHVHGNKEEYKGSADRTAAGTSYARRK